MKKWIDIGSTYFLAHTDDFGWADDVKAVIKMVEYNKRYVGHLCRKPNDIMEFSSLEKAQAVLDALDVLEC